MGLSGPLQEGHMQSSDESLWLIRGLRSSVGTKYVMALTGAALLLFVLAHMAGNLLIFRGQDAVNSYAQGLKDMGPLLWVARLGLLGIAIVHIASAMRLSIRNAAARPVAYNEHRPILSGLTSRTMVMSGLVILAFLVFHLLHLTLGVTHPEHYKAVDSLGRHDVFSMVVRGFQQAPVTIAYVVAMLLLGFHIKHGVCSLFQTLGINRPKYRPLTSLLGWLVAGAIVIGNCAMPLSIFFGLIKLPGGVN